MAIAMRMLDAERKFSRSVRATSQAGITPEILADLARSETSSRHGSDLVACRLNDPDPLIHGDVPENLPDTARPAHRELVDAARMTEPEILRDAVRLQESATGPNLADLALGPGLNGDP